MPSQARRCQSSMADIDIAGAQENRKDTAGGSSSRQGAERSDVGGRDGSDKSDDNSDKDDADKEKQKPSLLANPKIRIALIIGAIIAVIILVAWFLHYRSYSRFQQSTNDAYLAADQVNLAPRTSGYVEQMLVGDNQLVRAGQVLVRISSQDYNATADQSRAQIAQAEAAVAQAQAQRRMQFDTIRQNLAQAGESRATLRQYQETARFNQAQVVRYTPLSAAGAETNEKLAQNLSQLKQSRAQADSSRAQLSASDAQVAASRHQIAYFDAQIRSGHAQADSARAQLAANMVNVDAATVTSRIDGRIGDRTVRVGQYIQAGTRMMTVVPVDALYLIANFKETQIGLMRIGQPVTITVDALPGEDIHGTIESFSPGTGSRFALVPTDNATGNFTKIVQRVPVRIHVDAGPEAHKVLVPGLSATVSVDTRGARDDTQAQKDEKKRSEAERRRQHDRELEQDKRDHRAGAGR